jgi:glycosyltransferase involved in cell wall biosynthesis
MAKLIAQMIGRNEADRYLPDVLKHLQSIVDHIVFTDDASDDDTADVAEKHGASVYRNEATLFSVNEGQLRNQAWRNLTNHANIGDWILAIDCDEKLYSTKPKFSWGKILSQPYYDVVNIVFHHMWNETHYRVDKAWRPTGSYRLFKYFLGGTFSEKRLACGSEPLYVKTLLGRGRFMKDSGLVMMHMGYMSDEDKKAKYERYKTLDNGEFHSLPHIESILDPNPVLMPWNQ